MTRVQRVNVGKTDNNECSFGPVPILVFNNPLRGPQREEQNISTVIQLRQMVSAKGVN